MYVRTCEKKKITKTRVTHVPFVDSGFGNEKKKYSSHDSRH